MDNFARGIPFNDLKTQNDLLRLSRELQSFSSSVDYETAQAAIDLSNVLPPEMQEAIARSIARAIEPLATVAARAIASSIDQAVAGMAASISKMLETSGLAATLAQMTSATSVRVAASILVSDELADAVASVDVAAVEYPDAPIAENEPVADNVPDALRLADPVGLFYLRRQLTGTDLAFLSVVVSFVGSFALQSGPADDAAMITLAAFILVRAMLGNLPSSLFP